MMTTINSVKKILSLLSAVIVCLKAENSCAKIDFRLKFSGRFSDLYFQQEWTDVKSSCLLLCSRTSNCVGFAYDSSTRLCSLYDIDVANQGNITTQANTEIFVSPTECDRLSTENTIPNPPLGVVPVGHRYEFDCLKGSVYSGPKVARCLQKGTWDVPNIRCIFPKTCHQARQFGFDVSTQVKLKPLGNHSAEFFNCEISGDDIFTIGRHYLANRTYISGHEKSKSYYTGLTYPHPVEVLGAIADNSAECEQFLKLECSQSAFFYQGIVIRDGSLATYYAGGTKGEYNCACHINDSCLDHRKCNCNFENQPTSDSGYIRYKEDLPITGFRAGDTGNNNEYLYLTIGKMKCKG